ncbi:transcriptional regulator [Bacillota bacterium Meth-B3]|nr:hypothetical protein [Christensenellaceae bacterium]MEA5067934.1 hypothetical protein [Christensenellaceae bacterium]
MEDQQGKSSTRAKNKYNAANYDSLRIIIPKGQKATVQAAAEAAGESINGYVNGAVLARMGLEEWTAKEEDEPKEEIPDAE